MNPIKKSNQILSNYKNLIDKINNLPNNSLDLLLKGYKPLKENDEFNSIILENNKDYLTEKEQRDIYRIIQIVSDIDSAINEHNNSPCIDNLKAIIKSICNTYNLA
ncbi:MAG: hypothetical protein IJ086_13290 [Clostridium sp.]|nr:hypothetical protein [Clostridium sp.]